MDSKSNNNTLARVSKGDSSPNYNTDILVKANILQHAEASHNAELTLDNNKVRIVTGTLKAVNPFTHCAWWRLDSTTNTQVVENYVSGFMEHTKRSRRSQTITNTVSYVLAAMAWASKSGRPVKYSRNTHHSENRLLVEVVDYFTSLGLIVNVIGRNNEYQKCGSWYVTTDTFRLAMARDKMRLAFNDNENFLVLKSKANKAGLKKEIPITKNLKKAALIEELSAPIRAYNLIWLNHVATFNGVSLIPFNYRIFNERQDLSLGGRAYRGEYLALKQRKLKQRDKILIDGIKTVEPDYDALHLYLLYAMIGKQLPLKTEGYCPYQLDGFDRSVVKLAMLKLVNSTSKAKFIDGINKSGCPEFKAKHAAFLQRKEWYPRESLSEEDKQIRQTENGIYKSFISGMPDGINGAELLAAIEKKHADIKHLFCSPQIGLKLQRLDSDIIMQAVHVLSLQAIPVLPVHDSIRCRVDDEQAVIGAMKEAYKLKTGFYPSIS